MMRKSELKILKGTIFVAIVTTAFSIILFNIDILGNRLTIGQFSVFFSGIVGTIITFAGLYFIYKTYLHQNQQLVIAKYDSDLQIVNKLYSDILNEINSIQYRKTKNEQGQPLISETLYEGIDALYNFDSTHKENPNSVLNHLNLIIVSFDDILVMANKIEYQYENLKRITLTKIYFLYYSKVIWPVMDKIYPNRFNFELMGEDTDAILIFKNYERLTQETYKYLLEEKLVKYPKHEVMDKLLKNPTV